MYNQLPFCNWYHHNCLHNYQLYLWSSSKPKSPDFIKKVEEEFEKKVSKLILKSGVVPNACAGFLCFILNRSFCCSFGVLLLQLWCASLGSSYSSQIPLLHHLNTLLVPPSPLPPVQFCTVQTGVLAPLNRDI